MCGEVKAWVARKVAAVTRQHPSHVAAHVDATVTEYASSLGWTRLSALVDAEVVRADPVAAEARAKQVQDQLGVWVSPSEEGTKAVFAKADAPDVIFFDATIDRIADRLQALGDDSGHQTRRARALGLIARPGATLDLFETRTSDADVPDRGVDDPPVPVEAPNRRDPRGRRREPKRAVLYVHLSLDALATGQGVARLEDVGPITLGQVRDFLSGCQVTVTPVVDLANQAPVDGYEVPDRLREAVHLLAPADCFPYASATGRGLDVDHTERFRHRPGPDPNGRPPPGQTGPGNLGKLTRRHHRLKTHAGGWHVRQPYPGIWIWRTPHHRYYLVDHTGTRRLGTHRPNSAR